MSVRTLNPARLWRGVLHPEAFHGAKTKGPFFEGWYVKLVGPTGRTLVCIPGVFLGGDAPHAFIMVADTQARHSFLHEFPISDFWAAEDRFDVRIGPSRFHEAGIDLELPHDTWPIRGSVSYGALAPWPVTKGAPGCMGWYGWVPVLECYHGVVSMQHSLTGSLQIAGAPSSFHGGRGYIETDWGVNFPTTWVWVHGFIEQASVMVSIARVPWLGGSFPGFLAAVRLPTGELVRFATWTGAKVASVHTTDSTARVVIEDATWRLEVDAALGHPVELAAPSPAGMDRTVIEGVAGPVTARLYRDGKPLFTGSTEQGGVEVHGSADERAYLTTPGWRRD